MDKFDVVTRTSSWLTNKTVASTYNSVDATVSPRLTVNANENTTTSVKLSQFAVLWQQKEQTFDVLQTIVDQRRKLQQAEDLVDQLKTQISSFVKNYPPFPIGSEERLAYLRSISSLRKQIEALTNSYQLQDLLHLPKLPHFSDNNESERQWENYVDVLNDYQQQLTQLNTIMTTIHQHLFSFETQHTQMISDQQALVLVNDIVEHLRLNSVTLSNVDDFFKDGFI